MLNYEVPLSVVYIFRTVEEPVLIQGVLIGFSLATCL